MSSFVSKLRAVRTRRAVVVVTVLVAVAAAVEAGVVAADSRPHGVAVHPSGPVPRAPVPLKGAGKRVIVGHSYKHDVSRPVRALARSARSATGFHGEVSPNPRPASRHEDARDAVRQTKRFAPRMPGTTLSFDGIGFPGVACNCAPPDTNGEVGATQFVQMVNQGFRVFDKTTGAALTPATDIADLWSAFGGVCEFAGDGDPIVMYDQLAGRWLISQFAGVPVPTDECIAVSRTNDATGAWYRYGFHLGTDFFDYPHLGVWPDAYYMSMNVFNSGATAFLGSQPFAFDRSAMLSGAAATFVTTRDASVFNPGADSILPADLDGSALPPAGAPEPFLMSGPYNPTWPIFRFHVDFVTPANSKFTMAGTLAPAPYSALCVAPWIPDCVPQKSPSDNLDALADRGMFRLAYRNFGSHESLVGNMSVESNGVAGIRWYEMNHATSGTPSFVQQSTYQPDTTWRWMGSAAMDRNGNLALGFSASDATIFPQIRYAGRLASDLPNTLAQGEQHLFDGTGSQQGSNNRWGDYSDMTVDPVDDCTFWYTQEYYAATGSFDWRTMIGNFKFPPPDCGFSSGAHLLMQNAARTTRARAGAHLDFDVTLINAGPDPATTVVVTDNLPAGPGVNWAIDATDSNAGWSIVGSPPNEHLVGPSTLGATTLSHVHLVSSTTNSSCGAYANTASFTSGNGGSGRVSASTSVACQTVSVTKAGSGSGTVSSNPAGISCGSLCGGVFADGIPITLTAKPAVGSDFTGWSGGGCAGAGLCTFVLNGAKTITATFTLQKRGLTVVKKGNGRGSVTSSPAGIGCPSDCLTQFSYGTLVKLTPKPTGTSVFSGWSGACTGKAPCSLSMTSDRTATATFKAKCVVPKLRGLTLKKAKARIKRAHCTVGKVRRKASRASKKGKVLAQKPRPGKRLAPGAKVNVTVGKG
ncbi:MAG: InlB B-repeat-containing protein [Gaiellaceae bacterium]